MKLQQTLREMLWTFILVCLVAFEATSQMQLSLKPIASVNFSSHDIWNFDVLNAGTQTINVNFSGVIKDEKGIPLVKLLSAAAVVRPGANFFNKAVLSTIQLTYINSDVGKYESISATLPPGKYNYCVYLNCIESPEECAKKLDIERSIGDCNAVQVESPTPLLLSFPEDKAKLKEKRPNFTWIPPMPVGSNPEIRYELKLVQMLEKQTATDAIVRNRPLYRDDQLKGTFLPFPSALEDLKEGAKYAWQVTAWLGSLFVANSEVWEFEIKKPTDPAKYIRLKKQLNGGFIQIPSDQNLFVVYEGHYGNEEINCTLIGNNKKEIKAPIDRDENIPLVDSQSNGIQAFGEHKYIIKLTEMGLAPGFYLIRITDSRKMDYFVRILIKE